MAGHVRGALIGAGAALVWSVAGASEAVVASGPEAGNKDAPPAKPQKKNP